MTVESKKLTIGGGGENSSAVTSEGGESSATTNNLSPMKEATDDCSNNAVEADESLNSIGSDADADNNANISVNEQRSINLENILNIQENASNVNGENSSEAARELPIPMDVDGREDNPIASTDTTSESLIGDLANNTQETPETRDKGDEVPAEGELSSVIKEEQTFIKEEEPAIKEEPYSQKEGHGMNREDHSDQADMANAVADLAAQLAAEGSKDEDSAGADALATLAIAALGCNQAPTSTPASEPKEESESLAPDKRKESSEWYDVGIIRGTNCTVKKFYIPPEGYDENKPVMDFLNGLTPDYSLHTAMKLEPGTAYKFRIAAINSRGQGPWSEVSAFKTCLPGYPGAPSAIKISKSLEGAHLSWEPPPRTCGSILEYAVYLAVRSNQQTDPKAPPPHPNHLAFVRVYCGPTNQCTVGNASLAAAHVDTTTKPAIIFRIAARNEKGYGPATQVRWLQDATAQMKGSPTKRGGVRSHIPMKRPRDEGL